MHHRSPRVCVSVVNWNGQARTLACLESLCHLEYKNYEICVVDNDSVDSSVEHIRATFPNIRIICSNANLGYAGGHRQALEYALSKECELFWILNNDLSVLKNTLSELIEAYLDRPLGIFGSVALTADDPSLIAPAVIWEVDEKGKPAFERQLPLSNQRWQQYFSADPSPRVVANVVGHSLLIPLAVIRQYGFMDESFFMYGEETDYCLRLGQKGVASILVTSSVVLHSPRSSWMGHEGLQAMMRYYSKRNYLLWFRRHRGFLAYLLLLKSELPGAVRTWLKFSAGLGRYPFDSTAYYDCLAVRDALLGRTGKRLSPEHLVNGEALIES